MMDLAGSVAAAKDNKNKKTPPFRRKTVRTDGGRGEGEGSFPGQSHAPLFFFLLGRQANKKHWFLLSSPFSPPPTKQKQATQKTQHARTVNLHLVVFRTTVTAPLRAFRPTAWLWWVEG